MTFVIFNHNHCCLIKNLTPGNVRWVARQDVYTVTIVTKILSVNSRRYKISVTIIELW